MKKGILTPFSSFILHISSFKHVVLLGLKSIYVFGPQVVPSALHCGLHYAAPSELVYLQLRALFKNFQNSAFLI
jgi:hypothetical protein